MHGDLRGDEVHVGGDARQRFYDSRGYGRPRSGNEIALSRVEAAHLLFRGDLASVDGADFRTFFSRSVGDGFGVRFLVYKDLRERGFYLSPARDGWVSEPPAWADFVVYPRGSGPQHGEHEYAIRVVGERESIPATDLEPGVLAVVDEESELTYFRIEQPTLDGTSRQSLPDRVRGEVLADRVVLWDPPVELYRKGFFGQPLDGRESVTGTLQLSLVEGAYLAELGVLDVDGGFEALVSRGQAVEGDRFDRRLWAYTTLRSRGLVPKTGFKFGADFRTYAHVESVDELGHSELLVRVLPPEHTVSPRDLALDVRLAHGVRKRMVFALAPANDHTEPSWLAVSRLTP